MFPLFAHFKITYYSHVSFVSSFEVHKMKFLLFGLVSGQEGSGNLQVAPMAVEEPVAVPFAVDDVSFDTVRALIKLRGLLREIRAKMLFNSEFTSNIS